jgi:hypothetical protein
MNNLKQLNGWTGDGGYTSRTSAQSYLASGAINMTSTGCGSIIPLKLKLNYDENM